MKEPVEWSLKTFLAPWSYIASVLYHDFFWYPANQKLLNESMQSDWGRLFCNWEKTAIPPDNVDASGWPDTGLASTAAGAREKCASRRHYVQAMKILAECIRESPEFAVRKRTRGAKEPKSGA